MIRSSINHIVETYPGELFMPEINGSGITVYYEDVLGNPEQYTEGFLWDNPFGVDVHTLYINEDEVENPLRYFTNGGYEAYEVIDSEGNAYDVTGFTSTDASGKCVGDKAYDVEIGYSEGSIKIGVYIANEGRLVYLGDEQNLNTHIRPKKKYIDNFFKGLDSFETLLMNRQLKSLSSHWATEGIT